ncbi:MAG: carboxypeptidase-like regulatory domain-containing protein, partial [Bacteroidetes bacterium]|nr:carboxypeptidase-like regulatory domain-containing protein [Bacteroidota bacterium]MBU1578620.1 carboxypeptidase-like regulatory domain-containing protein [Bacteroidota bacterium]
SRSLLVVLMSITVSAFATNDGTKNAEAPIATTNMTGIVLDAATGEALVGAVIELENTGTKAYTDLEGRFSIENLTQGDYNVKVNYISYKEALLSKLTINQLASSVEIKLNPEGK